MDDKDELVIPEGPPEVLGNPPSNKVKAKAVSAVADAPSPATEPAPMTVAQLTSSPEFQAILAAAIAAATADITAKLEAARAAAGTKAEPEDASFAKQLAMEITLLADQGSKKVRVAPDEMTRRAEGLKRMQGLIIEAVATGKRPQYELKGAQFLHEQLIPSTYVDRMHVVRATQIEWSEAPNELMIPLNDIAVEIYAAFDQWLGTPTTHRARENTQDVRRDEPGLRIMNRGPAGQSVPQVGRAHEPTVKILGQTQHGEITEKRVLGTVAAPARQRQ